MNQFQNVQFRRLRALKGLKRVPGNATKRDRLGIAERHY